MHYYESQDEKNGSGRKFYGHALIHLEEIATLKRQLKRELQLQIAKHETK
jgi:hypothetical protein